jgi:hypothetical protein
MPLFSLIWEEARPGLEMGQLFKIALQIRAP